MSLELINTLATLGTFVVIAATAIAAIVQLRHMRGSNQIIAFNELRETQETEQFRDAVRIVNIDLPERMQDPAFRYQVGEPAARADEVRPLISKVNLVGNFYENMALLVRMDLVDRELICQMWSDAVIRTWEKLAPFTAIRRQYVSDALWENFEYLTVLAEDWAAAHPKGTYPVGVRRIDLNYPWLEADRQYAATIAT